MRSAKLPLTMVFICTGMTSVPALHDQGPIIDRPHLDRMTGGDSSLAIEVLGLFREQAEIWLRLLEPTTDTTDWAVAAHTVKGSARGIGAWGLGELCGQAEEVSRMPEFTRDQKRVWREDIANELDLVLAEIARIEHQVALASLRS
jgi:HPt (histidine-containing phosphotransfer) domain-containing protein